MVKTVRASTKPERLRFLQLITSTNNIRHTLGNEPTGKKGCINEEKIDQNEFIVGCYGYLSKRFKEDDQIQMETSGNK